MYAFDGYCRYSDIIQHQTVLTISRGIEQLRLERHPLITGTPLKQLVYTRRLRGQINAATSGSHDYELHPSEDIVTRAGMIHELVMVRDELLCLSGGLLWGRLKMREWKMREWKCRHENWRRIQGWKMRESRLWNANRIQRGKWTQLASSLAQGGKNSTPKGDGEFPRYMGHIDDCIVSSCH